MASKIITGPGRTCALTIPILAAVGCIGGYNECDPDSGVCPPPQPGVRFDELGFDKSVWFESARVGAPEELKPTICRVDLDAHPGEEVVLRGASGMAVLAVEGGEAVMRGVIAPINSEIDIVDFLDVDLDGNFEYFAEDHFEELFVMFDHVGEVIWNSPGSIERLRGVAFADVDGDGTLEFAARTYVGVEVFDAQGGMIHQLPGERFSAIEFGDFDGDGILELVTVSTSELVETWRLDGSRIASFRLGGEDWYPITDRLPDDDTRDYLRSNCTFLEIDGTVVGKMEPNEHGYCGAGRVDYVEPFRTIGSCAATRGEATVLDVRFQADRPPFRVQPSYSINEEGFAFLLAGFIRHHARRTILRIYDPDNRLVYHEVIASASGPESMAVIPSDLEGEEILLVADNQQILAYRFGVDGGRRSSLKPGNGDSQ